MLALLAAIAAATTNALAPNLWVAPAHFVWPARGSITTPFVPGGHPGIDIGILRSLTIRAAAAGRVEFVGERRGYEGYGQVVLVNVGGGYTTLYAHLSRFRVRAGDTVRAGEKLGVAGCTGWCTGTHLHFEVRFHGEAVDPARIPFAATNPLAKRTRRGLGARARMVWDRSNPGFPAGYGPSTQAAASRRLMLRPVTP